ncbi:IclR family transcriptional regulator [Paraburkholderia sp.]|uniref:IclR family transcriptional regulator n=1 Tax=Paraburkholderia sp. TaxID=1926495 RepID=UPI0039E60231
MQTALSRDAQHQGDAPALRRSAAVAAGTRPAARDAAVEPDVMVMPLARGLSILSAFGQQKAWLGNQDIALATGIPMPTVSRLLHSLVALGYLWHDEARRKYCLAAAALSLGYAAAADSDVQQVAGAAMEELAEATDTYVLLGTREQLDVIVLETRVARRTVLDLRFPPGTRMQIASSLMGWALLAALPEAERCYLQTGIERRAVHNWTLVRRRMTEKIAQVHDLGFCMLRGEWEPGLACVAAPVCIPEHPPFVLACVTRATCKTPTHIERELGLRLVATTRALRRSLSTGTEAA